MRYRKLGKTNYDVSEIGYGAWGIGGKQWLGGTDDESVKALERAIELGLNFIDTALAYGDGHSERLVGKIVKAHRKANAKPEPTTPAKGKAKPKAAEPEPEDTSKRIFIATKVPPLNRLWPAREGIGIEKVFPYDHIIRSTEQSLRNLGMDSVDLQQLHVWNPEWLERDEWKKAFEELKRSGMAKAVGISINDHQPDTALELIKTGLIDSVQVIYNIFDQTPATNLFPLAQAHNVGVIARVPLDEGALTGSVTESTQFAPEDFRSYYFTGDRKAQVVAKVNALKNDLPSALGPLAEVALRFCLSHPAVSTVIPGMRRVANAEANVATSDKGPLLPGTLETLRKHAWNKNFYF
jgi:aryl-alcohol dehydrogenase-like predicted oxidoreductase